MANILEIASNLANIDQFSVETDNNCFTTEEHLESADANLVHTNFPASPASIDWTGLTDAIQSDNGSDDTKGRHFRSSPQIESSSKEILSFTSVVDDSFDFYVKGLNNSPISSPGLANFLEDIQRENSALEGNSSTLSTESSVAYQSNDNNSTIKTLDSSDNYHTILSPSIHNFSSASTDSGVCSDNSDASVLSTTLDTSTTCKSDESTSSISDKRPDISYVEMIAKCILASRAGKVALSEIYDFILKTYPYFENAPPAWRISVRHHLSTCESFIKVGRVPLSRGFYWAIHSACKDDFVNGIFDRKLMRKRIGNLKPRKRVKRASENKPKEMDTKKDASNCVPVLPKMEESHVHATQASVYEQHNQGTVVNAYIDRAYNRLSGLTDNQNFKYSTPVQGYTSHYQYPVSTSLQHNSISNASSSLPYYGGMANSYYNSYGNYYSNGFMQAPMYNSQPYDNVNQYFSSPYGQHTLSGKINHQSSSRYLPY